MLYTRQIINLTFNGNEQTRHENSTLVVRHGLSHFSYYAGNEFRGVASLAKDFMKSKLFLSRANYFETANYIK